MALANIVVTRHKAVPMYWTADEVKFPWAEQLIRVFPRNAVTERKIFRAERNISSLSTPLTNSAEQNSSWTVLWFSSSVKFFRAIFLFGAMTCKWQFYLYIHYYNFGWKLISFRHLYNQDYLPKLAIYVNLSRINK